MQQLIPQQHIIHSFDRWNNFHTENPWFIIWIGCWAYSIIICFFPARPQLDQRGTNTGQIRNVPVDEIAWFLVYRMDETRSKLSANNGILVCLIQEIWQFKIFAGKEVTALPATRGKGGYWRWGRRLLCLSWNWIALSFFKHLRKKWLRTYHRLVTRTSKHI